MAASIPTLAQLAMSQEQTATTPTTFLCFARLPAELRVLIWRFALPDQRVLEVRLGDTTTTCAADSEAALDDTDSNKTCITHPREVYIRYGMSAVILPPPTLAHVSHEARTIALASRSGRGHGGGGNSNESDGGDPGRGSKRNNKVISHRLSAGGGYVTSWFDPETDVLCVDEFGLGNGAPNAIPLASAIAGPTCISLRSFAGSEGLRFRLHWLAQAWPWRLGGSSSLSFYHDSVTLHLRESPRVAQLFGYGADRCDVLLVDAWDVDRLRAVLETHRRDAHVSSSPQQQQQPSQQQNQQLDAWLQQLIAAPAAYVARCQADLRNLWACSWVGTLPPPMRRVLADQITDVEKMPLTEPGALLPAIPQFDHANIWIKILLLNVPELRVKVHFRLCRSRHEDVAVPTSPVIQS